LTVLPAAAVVVVLLIMETLLELAELAAAVTAKRILAAAQQQVQPILAAGVAVYGIHQLQQQQVDLELWFLGIQTL
jgi:hypothetical protein